MGNKSKELLQDRIPPASDDHLWEIVLEGLQHEKNRQHIKLVIAEYVDSVPFMEKVRKYAGMELDSRLYKSVGYWLTIILTSAASVLVGMLFEHLFKH